MPIGDVIEMIHSICENNKDESFKKLNDCKENNQKVCACSSLFESFSPFFASRFLLPHFYFFIFCHFADIEHFDARPWRLGWRR